MRTYWVGHGRGQAGEAGTAYRRQPDGRWQRQERGYSVLRADGSRGWREGAWEEIPSAAVPADIRRAEED